MIRTLEKRRWLSLLLLILIGLEIYVFSSIPSSRGDALTSSSFIPVIYHIIVFFLFTFFLTALLKGRSKLTWKIALIIFIITLAYATFDEFHQSMVPGRDASLRDILYDAMGGALALAIYALADSKRKNKFSIFQEMGKHTKEIIEYKEPTQ